MARKASGARKSPKQSPQKPASLSPLKKLAALAGQKPRKKVS